MTTAKNDDFIALQLEHFGNERIFDKWEGTLGLPPIPPSRENPASYAYLLARCF